MSVGASAVLGYGLDFYNILIVSFLMGAIRHDLNINLTEAGVITTVTLLGSVMGGILFGWVGDRVGRKQALMWALGIFSGAAILSAFSWNFASLLVLRGIAGIGLGAEWGAGMVLFNEVWPERRRGLGTAIVQAATNGGIAAASVVAAWALTSFSSAWGWRIALLIGGAPIFLMIYVRFRMPESRLWRAYDELRRSGRLPPEKSRESSPLLEILKGESAYYTIIGCIMVTGFMFSFYSVAVFMPELMKDLGAPITAVRSATLLWALVTFIAMMLNGWFSDHTGRRLGVIVPSVIELMALVGFYFLGAQKFTGAMSSWPLYWLYALWGVGTVCASMFGCWFSELFPVELRASGTSSIYMVGRGVGSLAPYLVPVIAAGLGGNILNAMLIGGACILIALISALLLPETAGRGFAVIETKKRET